MTVSISGIGFTSPLEEPTLSRFAPTGDRKLSLLWIEPAIFIPRACEEIGARLVGNQVSCFPPKAGIHSSASACKPSHRNALPTNEEPVQTEPWARVPPGK